MATAQAPAQQAASTEKADGAKNQPAVAQPQPQGKPVFRDWAAI